MKATENLLNQIEKGQVNLKPAELKELTTKLQHFRAQNPDLAGDAQVAAILADRFSDEAMRLANAREKKIQPMRAELAREIEEYNNEVRRQNGRWQLSASATIGAPFDLQSHKDALESKERALLAFERDNPIVDVRSILEDIASERPEMEDVRQGIIASYAYEPDGSIKTPSIVISWYLGNIAVVGGHNIGARTLKLEPSEDVRGIVLEETENGSVIRRRRSRTGEISISRRFSRRSKSWYGRQSCWARR